MRPARMSKGLLIDFTKCIGCRACMEGCREANGLPQPGPDDPNPTGLNGDNYTVVLSPDEQLYYRRLCMHCLDPACVSVCPVAAITKRDDGPVVYDGDRCFGCRYCIMSCPFQVPTYTWDRVAPVVSKCILCYHRLDEGQEPACAAACPTGATRFGPREVLLRIARERIAARPDLYVDHIYGEKEAGGTGILMLSPVSFASLGFRVDVPHGPLPDLTWVVQEKIPNVVLTGGVFLGGLYWVIHRRMALARKPEGEDA